MPQHFQVLRCYKCSVFQVHQTKNTNKFQCKLCGEKQSIKRHYGVGTGKDCRLHVQKLNGIRGELDELSSSLDLNKDDSVEDNDSNQYTKPITIENQGPNKSKWSNYVEKEIPEVNIEETMYIDDKEVVLEVPKKRFKKLGRNFTSPAVKPAKSIKYEEDAEEIVASNEKIDLSLKDSNFPTKSMNIPLSKHKKFELSQNCNVTINHINEVPSDCENYNIKPNPVVKEKLIHKKVLFPVVESNSKWAQFVDNDGQDEEGKELWSPSSDHNPCNDPQTLFSLCDDSDLDKVLDI